MGRAVLYASGEESAQQLHLRADRLGLTEGIAGERIHVLAATELEVILAVAETSRPQLLIVDSVQTVTCDGLEGPAGSVGQVREAASRLAGWARQQGVPVILVGHVTKDGSLAGPRTLEHLVDAVLLLEGDRYGSLRILRAAKNRFGSTEEVGVLEMTGEGLREVDDPARAFLGEGAREAPGVAIAAILEGTRPLLVEVQALVAPASGMGAPRRTVAGVDGSRRGAAAGGAGAPLWPRHLVARRLSQPGRRRQRRGARGGPGGSAGIGLVGPRPLGGLGRHLLRRGLAAG